MQNGLTDNAPFSLSIDADLDKVPADVTKITFALSSYSGENFDEVENEFVQIRDMSNGNIVAKTQGPITGNGKTLKFIELQRVNNEWIINTLNQYFNEDFKTFANSHIA